MEKLKKFRHYLESCDREKLLMYVVQKHNETHGDHESKEDEKHYIQHLLRSYNFVIDYLKSHEPDVHDDFIIHVEHVDDQFESSGYISIYCVPKSSRIMVESDVGKIPWGLWLGSDMYWDDYVGDLIEAYGIELLVAECLYELTFYNLDGGSNDDNTESTRSKNSLKGMTVADILLGRLRNVGKK